MYAPPLSALSDQIADSTASLCTSMKMTLNPSRFMRSAPSRLQIIMLTAMVALTATAPSAHAAIVEVGDLNIISDPDNPSDGLRFLDMSYSMGLPSAAALANAQAVYPNARMATPKEFDDLFAAAGITYIGTDTASDGFTVGPPVYLSVGSSYDGSALAYALGIYGNATYIWTDPDNSDLPTTTRDYLVLGASFDYASLSQANIQPPFVGAGFLIVSQPPPPAPLADGLIAHWRMDEVGTTYVHDSVGRSHGTRVGGSGNHPGISGRATSFEGASYGVTATNQLGDFGAGDFTISVSVKMTSPLIGQSAYPPILMIGS